MDIAAILTANYPDALWTLDGDDYSELVWNENNEKPKPKKSALEAAWPDVQNEIAWRSIRSERDRLLAASDWTQVADAPVDAEAWATYRQQLRDLPQNYILPSDVEWPQEP